MENDAARANQSTSQLRRGKTVEQIYQKKTQLEHILLRPDTYVGSIEHQLQEMWVYDESRDQMVYRKIDYVPALYKIFDEILVNAADNAQRDPKGMDLIEVTIDRQQGSISVLNNGQGIPVQMHREHKCYVPELIFGHLLTSDNYDDNEKKVTGGRNGFGAKLANVFSKKFIVETVDKASKKKFTQVFQKNMSQKDAPSISDCRGDKEYTKITFWPDFARFGMTGLDLDITSLMMKRSYDVAATTNKRIKVILNGKRLPVTCFEEYVRFYLQNGAEGGGPAPCVHEICNDRWEVAFSLSDGNFNQVSFVNSIATIKGGTHVAHVSDQVVEAVLKVVKGKNRGGMEIKPAHVRNHLWVFISCLIENPSFDSQTKESLTLKQSKFGSTCEVPERMIKQVLKSGIVETILDWAKAKQKVDLSKQLRAGKSNTGRVHGIPKLEDANDAGGRHSQDCTLILTEGDSAKSLAVAGLAVVGRDKYGVFPLKGKVLNVRDANFKQVSGNTEISNLLQIMGLDLKSQYDSTAKLRYGSIMLMTDQDHDGSHIKGLLMNLIGYWWPSLLKMNGFLKEFITPIVKVWKDGKKDSERRDETSFFTLKEYEAWKERTNNGKGWKSKYYKGLGTSTMKEAKEYFRDIERHEVKFRYTGEHDCEAIDLAFNKKRADDRKNWINGYEEGTFVDHTKPVDYTEFIHKELVQFAKYDVQRSVPSVVDGFKPSQRKVLFCAFKKRLRTDIKVAQFVGYISEQSAYHHGEVSLENTIVNLAQNFVGSNNTNLLVPSGQFGTRLQGGKDHAASRYIYTRLSPITRVLFNPDDDHVLEYLEEEGLSIEPKWYCPTLPTVLVNGADGIGVGWSTSIPNYNPREMIANIRKLLRGMAMTDMHPWFKGYMGSIEPNPTEPGRYEVTGVITKRNETTLEITELPIKSWTQNYKEFLEELMPKDSKKGEESDHTIEDFREYHTESSVHFVLTLTPQKMREVEQFGLEKKFKLKTSLATSNMVLFDAEGKISRYNTALDILREFCKLRRKVYVARKAYLVAKLTRETEILSNKARFILMVVKGELELRKKKKAVLLQELKDLKFTPMSQLDAIMKGKTTLNAPQEAEAPTSTDGPTEKSEYDYLLNMNLWSLTFEKVEEIKKQLEIKKEELQVLQGTTEETMWDRDLEALSAALDEIDRMEEEEALAGERALEGRKRKRGRAAMPPPAPVVKPPQRTPATSSTAWLKQPLVDCSKGLDGEVAKTVWGTGEDQMPLGPATSLGQQQAKVRGLRSEAQSVAPPAASLGQRTGPGRRPRSEAESVAPASLPSEEKGSAGLLMRLLNKSSSTVSEPVELDGAEDLFSSLGTMQSGGSSSSMGHAAPKKRGRPPRRDAADVEAVQRPMSGAHQDTVPGSNVLLDLTERTPMDAGPRSAARSLADLLGASRPSRPPGESVQSAAVSLDLDSDSDAPLTTFLPGDGGAQQAQPQKRRRRLKVLNDDDDSDFGPA
eukprot:TRINITY_DN56718_c0_g1_i1.p1 TRINITY_DN56718_c0_g1~~TRINITY_DN56718_c0_g1_i1.p1  ORF type:complete len:1479 (+),score=323.22 TRINITY_DN56718_c0_g1_i1:52-4488(+)